MRRKHHPDPFDTFPFSLQNISDNSLKRLLQMIQPSIGLGETLHDPCRHGCRALQFEDGDHIRHALVLVMPDTGNDR